MWVMEDKTCCVKSSSSSLSLLLLDWNTSDSERCMSPLRLLKRWLDRGIYPLFAFAVIFFSWSQIIFFKKPFEMRRKWQSDNILFFTIYSLLIIRWNYKYINLKMFWCWNWPFSGWNDFDEILESDLYLFNDLKIMITMFYL